MFKNYLRTALRFLKQNKVFAGINVLGLSIALTASFIILLYVINELSYDHCHKNRKNIFKVLNYSVDFKNTQSGTPYVLAGALKEEFPQVEKAVRTGNLLDFKLKLKDEFIPVSDVVGTDSEVFDIFTLPLVVGTNNQHLLDNLNSIVISHELAEKFFQGKEVIGKEMVALLNGKEEIFTVSAVYKDIPVNSTFRAKCFVNGKWSIDPNNSIYDIADIENSWLQNSWDTWVLLSKNSDIVELQQQFRAFEKKNLGEKPDRNYSLQNLSDVYLGSADVANTWIKGNVDNIRLFSAIAFLILLVAAINYIILSIAVSSGRAKEIGIRKTNGASTKSIKNQLLSESVFLAMLALPIALLLMWLALPFAAMLFQTQLHIIGSNIIVYAMVYMILTILIGVFSGIYTSSYLSRLNVMDVLKSTSGTGNRKQFFRSSLIVLQLVIFCSFLASTLIIRSQYQFALKKDTGYFKSNILTIHLGNDFQGYSAFINNVKMNSGVIMAAGAVSGLPLNGSGGFMVQHFQDRTQQVKVENLSTDFNFLKSMGISVIEGRDFSEEFGGDLEHSVILNETAVKQLGITEPIGKRIGRKTIIGIVKDFNLHSIHNEIPPLWISLTDSYIQELVIHYKQGTLMSLLPMLEKEWKKTAPDRPFQYSTIEELMINAYSSEKNLSTIVSIFALFTLLIASFGLFGLTLFFARTRTKEIGIKKVFGSSGKTIVYSFLRGNLGMVTLASVLSIPVTIYFMSRWLDNFTYHTTISWWVFAATFAAASVVVLSTVLFHSWRASRINPIEALRHD